MSTGRCGETAAALRRRRDPRATSRSSRRRSTASRSSISTTPPRRRSRRAVIDAERDVYEKRYANIHRGVHWLSVDATDAYEAAREKARRFLNAARRERDRLRARHDRGDQPRRADLRPRPRRRRRRGPHHRPRAPLEHRAVADALRARRARGSRVAPIDDARRAVDLDEFERLLTPRTRIVVGRPRLERARHGQSRSRRDRRSSRTRRGVPVLVDGAQAAPRMPVDVQELGCDFYALLRPQDLRPDRASASSTAEAELLEAMPPYQGGGDMIRSVTFEKTTYNALPYKFEAGTPNIAGGDRASAPRSTTSPAIGLERDRAPTRTSCSTTRPSALTRDPGPARRRHGARKGRRPLVRARRRPPARHRHGARPRGHRGPHRPPLRAAGHGPLRRARRRRAPRSASTTRASEVDALVAGDPQSHRRCSAEHDRRPARPLPGSHPRPQQAAAELPRAAAAPNRKAEGYNPLCGDRETVFLDARRRRRQGRQLPGRGLRDLDGLGVDDDRERQGQDAAPRPTRSSSGSTT